MNGTNIIDLKIVISILSIDIVKMEMGTYDQDFVCVCVLACVWVCLFHYIHTHTHTHQMKIIFIESNETNIRTFHIRWRKINSSNQIKSNYIGLCLLRFMLVGPANVNVSTHCVSTIIIESDTSILDTIYTYHISFVPIRWVSDRKSGNHFQW